MVRTILIFCLGLTLAVDVSFKDQCTCSKFASDTACLEQVECIWKESICQARSCSEYYLKDKCNSVASCSWNIQKCDVFTKCSDYFMNDSYDCYKIGNDETKKYCQPTSDGNLCEDYLNRSCGSVEEDCQGFANQWLLCYWESNQCNEIDVRYCDQLINEDLCTIFGDGIGCMWDINIKKCRSINCSDFTQESTCVLTRQNFIDDNIKLCSWNVTQCVDAPDVSHLDYSNCLVNSFYNYIWDSTNQVCTQCINYNPITQVTP